MPAGLEREQVSSEAADAVASGRSAVPAFAAFLYLALGLAATAAYFMVPAGWQNQLFDVIGASSVVAILVGTVRNRPRRPWAWYLMALGQLLFVIGDVSWTVVDLVLEQAPFLSLADIAYLAAYVPLTAGLSLIVRARRPGRDVSTLIDAGIITVAAAVAAWLFVMAPQAARVGAPDAETIVTLAYPAADILLIAVAATFVLTNHTSVRSSRLIGASLVALIVADILYVPATLNGWYRTGSPIDTGWMLSYVFWGAAALHPSMRVLTEPTDTADAPRFTRRRLIIDSLAVVAIPVMWGIQAIRGAPRYSMVVLAASTVASLLVIARMSGLLATLEGAALHDPLTGLPNRRLLYDRIGQAFRRGQRAGTPVVLMFCDLHGLKNVNDRFGHEAGDGALIEMGRRIESSLRASDTVARLGGDEFVIVCEGLDRPGAELIADRIRARVAAPLLVGEERVEFSVDVGIAIEAMPAGSDASALLRTADRAMYEAKAATPESTRPDEAS